MRIATGWTAVLLLIAASGCSRPSEPARHEPVARKAGHVAYAAAQESKEVAKKAGHELKSAGRNFHDGWKEARQQSKEQKGH